MKMIPAGIIAISRWSKRSFAHRMMFSQKKTASRQGCNPLWTWNVAGTPPGCSGFFYNAFRGARRCLDPRLMSLIPIGIMHVVRYFPDSQKHFRNSLHLSVFICVYLWPAFVFLMRRLLANGVVKIGKLSLIVKPYQNR